MAFYLEMSEEDQTKVGKIEDWLTLKIQVATYFSRHVRGKF